MRLGHTCEKDARAQVVDDLIIILALEAARADLWKDGNVQVLRLAKELDRARQL